jgi:predicted small lipoprotein YifL
MPMRSLRWLSMAIAVALASCGRSGGPLLPPAAAPAAHASCYVVKQDPQTVSATITFYGWPDNSPPGKKIAHGVIHKRAGGDGTYCNPTTFATERANDKQIPYGIKIYVPFIKQYFMREDLCAASGPKKGSGSNGCKKLWFDLWIGGDAKSRARAVIKCERELTPDKKVQVILYPDDGMPVAHAGPIYRDDPPPNGTCDGTQEGSSAVDV